VLLRRAREWAEGVGELVEEIQAYPALMVWADMPRLTAWHAAAPLGDIAAGADVAIGPTLDGGLYLLALAAPQPRLLDVRASGHSLLATAGELGLEAGLLRPERAVRTENDRRALLADPLLPAEVRAALTRERSRRGQPPP
jgi:hypothetical protein